MARHHSITANGKLENLVFYHYRGMPCVRTVPAKVRQTNATKKSALDFGKAARIGKSIRTGLSSLFEDLQDPTVMNRLNGVLVKCLHFENAARPNFSRLKEFNFNTAIELFSRLKTFPELFFDGEIAILSLPEFQREKSFVAPLSATTVVLTLAAVCIDPGSGIIEQNWSKTIELDGSAKANQWKLPFSATKGKLLVAGAALRYYKDKEKKLLVSKPEWKPAGITNVFEVL